MVGTIPHLAHALHGVGVVHCPGYLEMTHRLPAPSSCLVHSPDEHREPCSPSEPLQDSACCLPAIPQLCQLPWPPIKPPQGTKDGTGAASWARTQANCCVKMYRGTMKYALDICKRLLITRSVQVPAPGRIFFPKPGIRSLFFFPKSWSPSVELQPGWWGDKCQAGGGAGAGSVPRWAGTAAGGAEMSLCSCSCPPECPSRPCPASLGWDRL